MMKIFISYSHVDRAWCDDLARQLLGIDRNIVSDVWYDKSIQPGDNWDAEIQKRMAMSDVIVLLISSNFVGAKFCPFEAERALELKESNSCTIVPVLLRKCLYESLGLGRMDTSPHGSPPVDSPGWDGPDDALTQVANEVRAAAVVRLGVPVRRHGFEPDRSAQLKKCRNCYIFFATVRLRNACLIAR
jgi:TIR domain